MRERTRRFKPTRSGGCDRPLRGPSPLGSLARCPLVARWFLLAAFLSCCLATATWAQTPGVDAANDAGSAAATNSAVEAANEAPPEGVSKSALQWIRDGGPMMVPIILCSLTLCIYALERAFVLRHDRVIPGPFVHRLIDQIVEGELKADEALTLCAENGSPISEVFVAAIKKWGRPSVEVEQAVLDSGERVASRLRKNLRVFHGVSTVGPLLGLLGTVFGMIESFNAVASSDAMGRPELLAAGISEALITTAGGLSVAIPAILSHLFFIGRVDRLVSEIDQLGQEMVNAIASDGWREKRDKKPAKTVKPKAA